MKLDLLVFSAHPDDAELGCGGTIIKAVHQGRKVGIVDLTKGELGSRGTVEIRAQEAASSAEVLGVEVRENMGFRDGFFTNDESHQLALIKMVRRYQPEVVLAAAPYDRHPDHARASRVIVDACFLSGLVKIETKHDDQPQSPWRPAALYHFIQSVWLEPDFVVDVSEHWEQKMQAIKAYRSQFFNDSPGPETYINNPQFLKMIEARGVEFGHSIGVQYGEGFIANRNVGVKDLFELL